MGCILILIIDILFMRLDYSENTVPIKGLFRPRQCSQFITAYNLPYLSTFHHAISKQKSLFIISNTFTANNNKDLKL